MSNEPALVENIDFYFDENGLFIFTKSYLEKRGTCCGLGCKHCPYDSESEKTSTRNIVRNDN